MPGAPSTFRGGALIATLLACAQPTLAEEQRRRPSASLDDDLSDACRPMFPEPTRQRVSCLGRNKPEPVGNPGHPPAERQQPATKP